MRCLGPMAAVSGVSVINYSWHVTMWPRGGHGPAAIVITAASAVCTQTDAAAAKEPICNFLPFAPGPLLIIQVFGRMSQLYWLRSPIFNTFWKGISSSAEDEDRRYGVFCNCTKYFTNAKTHSWHYSRILTIPLLVRHFCEKCAKTSASFLWSYASHTLCPYN